MQSSNTDLPAKVIRTMSSGAVSEVADQIQVVENSKKNKETYERDLSEMMRLSSARRFKWESVTQFFIAGISYLIGYDSSFAYLRTFANHGIVMLIPFLIILVCYAIPILYLEIALGQYSSLDPSLLFRRLSPAMAAIGYMSWGIALLGMVSNQGIVMLCFDLFITSCSAVINGDLSFQHCHHFYNTEGCIDTRLVNSCDNATETYFNGGCLQNAALCPEQISYANSLKESGLLNLQRAPAYQYMLGGTFGFNNGYLPWNPRFHVVILTLLAWLMIGFIAKGGIKLVCKISYANVVATAFVLILLISSGLMVSKDLNFQHFTVFRLEKLWDYTTWISTFGYVSTCLKLGQGGLITIGSYNDFHSNIFFYMLVVILAVFFCPLLISLCISPLYGSLIEKLSFNRTLRINDYEDFMQNYNDFDGLVTTSSALSTVSGVSGGLLTLFAISMLLLALGNLMMRMILMVNSIREHFPMLEDKYFLNNAICIICVTGCLVNFSLFTLYGAPFYYALIQTLLPTVSASIALFEALTVAHCYGSKKMFTNIQAMLFGKEVISGSKSRRTGLWRLIPYFNGYMMICWGYVTPVSIAIYLIGSFTRSVIRVQSYPPTHKPAFQVIVPFSILVILIVPTFATVAIIRAKCRNEPISMVFRPNLMLWGPRQKKHRVLAQKQEEKWRI